MELAKINISGYILELQGRIMLPEPNPLRILVHQHTPETSPQFTRRGA
jgi:hypothetical protein